MSEIKVIIGEGLPVLVDYDYDDNDQEVVINSVCIAETDIKDILSDYVIEGIEQKVFDSFDSELVEPERFDDEYMD